MVKFNGEISSIGKTRYYNYSNSACGYGNNSSCGAFAKALLIAGPVSHSVKNENDPTWGYCGTGPDLLSVSVLAFTLDEYWLDQGGVLVGVNVKHDKGSTHKARKEVIKLHKQFTKEAVSKLPPKWTMTSHEVLAWIKDGTLPDCIQSK